MAVMSSLHCFRCRVLIEGPAQPIWPIFRWAASLSLAPMHGGAWAWEEYSKDYCRKCRRLMSLAAVAMAVAMSTVGILLFQWIIKKGLSPFRS